MDTYIKYQKKAINLVNKLTQKIKDNPSAICENFGQKEIHKFIDDMGMLTYQEQCNIKDILYKVSEIGFS